MERVKRLQKIEFEQDQEWLKTKKDAKLRNHIIYELMKDIRYISLSNIKRNVFNLQKSDAVLLIEGANQQILDIEAEKQRQHEVLQIASSIRDKGGRRGVDSSQDSNANSSQ